MQGHFFTTSNPATSSSHLRYRGGTSPIAEATPAPVVSTSASAPNEQANGVNITINYPQTTVSNGGTPANSSQDTFTKQGKAEGAGKGEVGNKVESAKETKGQGNSPSNNGAEQPSQTRGSGSLGQEPSGTKPNPNGQSSLTAGSGVNTSSATVLPSTETPQGHLIQIYERLNDAYAQAEKAHQSYMQLRDNYTNQAQAYTQLAQQMNNQAWGQYNANSQGGSSAAPNVNPSSSAPAAFMPAQNAMQPQALQAQQATSSQPMAGSQAPSTVNANGGLNAEQLRQMVQDPAIQQQAMQLASKVDPAQLQAMLQDPAVMQMLQQLNTDAMPTGTATNLPALNSPPLGGQVPSSANPALAGGQGGLPPQGFMA